MQTVPHPSQILTETEARERIAAARRAGNPVWLWPDVTPAAWRAALVEIERVTRDILAGKAEPAVLRAAMPSGAAAMSVAAYTSGMGPLLGYWLEAGMLQADAEIAQMLRLHLEQGRLRNVRLTRDTESLTRILVDRGVHVTVLKGMHTAYAYFPDPGTRVSADIDLLVSPRDIPKTVDVMRARGYEIHDTQHRPYKAAWRPVGGATYPRSLMMAHADDPVSVDIHASLDRNFFGVARVRLDDVGSISSSGQWRNLEGVHVLGEPVLALLLATHASEGLHNLRLIRLVELVLVMRADRASGALSWDAFAHAARSANALRFAYPALALANALAPETIPADVLAVFADAATPAMRNVIGELTPATAQRLDSLSLQENWMWAGNNWERLRRLLHSLWPAPAGRSPGRLSAIYASRAWRLLRGTVVR